MIIFVRDSRNRVLSPTTKVDWMNKMLRKGKAKLSCRKLMLLTLNYPVTSKSNDEYIYSIGLDTGYSNIGFCVIKSSKTKVILLFKGDLTLRTADITKLLTERKMYRNIRRRNRRHNCKFKKFRSPRYRNRRDKLKFNPSMRFLIQSHINIFINFIFKYVEHTKSVINLEYAKFDSQLLSGNGNLNGQGVNSNFNNTKAFVLARDKYTCQKCNSTKVLLHVHHIVFKSQGGSNSPSNLITLCDKCHSKVHTGSITSQFTISNSYKDSGLLNSVMPSIYKEVASYIPTYKYFGYETKFRRENFKLTKSHSNDAQVLSMFDLNFTNKKVINSKIDLNLTQYRRHNRAAVKRQEDRKYYYGREIIARNRKARTGQTYDSLIEMRKAYIDVKLKVRSGKLIYNQRTKNKPFTPGDILNNKQVVTGFSSTQNRVFSKTHYFKIKSTKRLKRNSGLTVL